MLAGHVTLVVLRFLQASDILIAAAPISVKKQDLADLELGVSCQSQILVGSPMLHVLPHATRHSACLGTLLVSAPVSSWSLTAFDCCFSYHQVPARIMDLQPGPTSRPLNGSGLYQCWHACMQWRCSCCCCCSGGYPAQILSLPELNHKVWPCH